MSDEVIDNENQGQSDAERQAEAEAIAQMTAGYNRSARADEAPADDNNQPSETPDRPATDSIQQPQPEPTLAEQLAALKAQVKAMAGQGDPDALRKMYGEIGNINRTLKQIQDSQPKPPPVKDDLTLALEEAEQKAAEWPEIAGPLVRVTKLLKEKVGQAPAQPVGDIRALVNETTTQQLQRTAIEQLAEEHPDFETVRDTDAFKAWEATKTPEFQKRLRETWNPAVVSKALTEFKDSQRAAQQAREAKHKRLESAVVTPGRSGQAKPTTQTEEDQLWAGYQKGPKRLNTR
jgi:hypothetical protein